VKYKHINKTVSFSVCVALWRGMTTDRVLKAELPKQHNSVRTVCCLHTDSATSFFYWVAHRWTGMVNFTIIVRSCVRFMPPSCSAYLERVNILTNISDARASWATFLICPSDRMTVKME
jgi:hypothetical protein